MYDGNMEHFNEENETISHKLVKGLADKLKSKAINSFR
jgi:hypothetical protein